MGAKLRTLKKSTYVFHLIRILTYLIGTLLVFAFFKGYLGNQMDFKLIALAAFAMNFFSFFYFLDFIHGYDYGESKILDWVARILLLFSFILGWFAFCEAFSYFNQRWDDSKVLETKSVLILDRFQKDVEKKATGDCFKFKGFEDSTMEFGRGDLCRDKFPGANEGAEVLIRYREGDLLGARWMVNYEFRKL